MENKYQLLSRMLLALILIPEIYAEEIEIATGEWAPYSSEKLQYYGLANQIIRESLALEGIKVKFIFLPWTRSYLLTQQGDFDATGVWFSSLERKKQFYYSDAILESNHHFFHLKSYSFDWNTLDDLKGIRIGGKLGSTKTENFLAMEKGGILDVVNVATDEQAFKMLKLERIDIYPQNITVSHFLLQQLFTPEQIQSFTYHPKPFRQSSVHLLFPKEREKTKRLLEAFNKGLSRLKDSGKYKQYFDEFK